MERGVTIQQEINKNKVRLKLKLKKISKQAHQKL